MTPDRIKFLSSKTNGAVFDDDGKQLTELDYPDLYYYDRDAAMWAREFMEKTSHILESGHNFTRGDQAKLLEWHLQSCCNIYGVKKKEDKLRRYHFEFILMPKKNAKSPYSAIRSNYHLIADGEARGYIVAVAADKDNGKIIHDYAKDLIIIEEEIGKTMLNKRLTIRRDDIFHTKSRSRFKVTSADVKSKHGANISVLFIDEPHSWEPEETAEDRYSTFTKGIIARRQPLVSMTSTAGYKSTWFHKTKYDYAKKLLGKHIRDDRWFVMIYEPDVQGLIDQYGQEWDDEKGLKPWFAYEQVWKDTNPAYGVTVKREYFESEVNMIRNAPENLNAFLRLHLNVFTGTTVEWTIANKWDILKKIINFNDLKEKECYCGVYTSKPKDLTSICLFFPNESYMLWKFFAPRPASNLRKSMLSGYAERVKDGHIIEIDTPYISSDDHLELISRYLDQVRCTKIFCRPEDEEVASKLHGKYGADVETLSTIGIKIKAATQVFQNMVSTKQITHNGNPMISYQIGMTEIAMKNDTIRPDADASRDNICGVYAGLLAVAASMNAEPAYEPQIVSIDL